MKFDVYDAAKKKLYDIELSGAWQNASSKCLHEVIVSRLANNRQGTVGVKTRSEVRGTGAKPFKQKGLGRARRGSNYSPLIRGGGVSFGPQSRDFRRAISKKKKANAYLFLFSELYRKGNLLVLNELPKIDASTKSVKSFLQSSLSESKGRIVVIDIEYNLNMLMGSANLEKVAYYGVEFLDILPVFYADNVLVTEDVMKRLDSKYSNMVKSERGSRW